MRSALARPITAPANLRPAVSADIDALLALERLVFATDRMSRRSVRRFLTAPTSILTVAEVAGAVAGYALTLFPPRSAAARLYSIAVSPTLTGRGIGATLLAAAEAAAEARDRTAMRLEVYVGNDPAISCYRRYGYREIGTRERYYDDGGDALRFEKRLYPPCPAG
jgi:ribosomal protein S18 acetylase RimI-like enzyme